MAVEWRDIKNDNWKLCVREDCRRNYLNEPGPVSLKKESNRNESRNAESAASAAAVVATVRSEGFWRRFHPRPGKVSVWIFRNRARNFADPANSARRGGIWSTAIIFFSFKTRCAGTSVGKCANNGHAGLDRVTQNVLTPNLRNADRCPQSFRADFWRTHQNRNRCRGPGGYPFSLPKPVREVDVLREPAYARKKNTNYCNFGRSDHFLVLVFAGLSGKVSPEKKPVTESIGGAPRMTTWFTMTYVTDVRLPSRSPQHVRHRIDSSANTFLVSFGLHQSSRH